MWSSFLMQTNLSAAGLLFSSLYRPFHTSILSEQNLLNRPECRLVWSPGQEWYSVGRFQPETLRLVCVPPFSMRFHLKKITMAGKCRSFSCVWSGIGHGLSRLRTGSCYPADACGCLLFSLGPLVCCTKQVTYIPSKFFPGLHHSIAQFYEPSLDFRSQE